MVVEPSDGWGVGYMASSQHKHVPASQYMLVLQSLWCSCISIASKIIGGGLRPPTPAPVFVSSGRQVAFPSAGVGIGPGKIPRPWIPLDLEGSREQKYDLAWAHARQFVRAGSLTGEKRGLQSFPSRVGTRHRVSCRCGK